MIDVKLRNMIKSYDGGDPVVNDVNLEVKAGEFFFLLGPSGCGKSTLLRIIAGLLAPTAGSVFFGDEDVTRSPAERRRAAMVFQSYALWPHMSVFENVAFGLRIERVSSDELKRRTMEALELTGMATFANRPPTALSGGQQQRVALARALVVRPRVLLLDEPLSNLDAKLRATMRGEIRAICEDASLTAIYVTHDQKEALSMADRLAVLRDGRVEQIGAPRDVHQRPINTFVADFIGAGNFLSGTIIENGENQWVVETPLGRFKTQAVADIGSNADVQVMIRPENLRVTEADGGSDNQFAATIVDETFLGEFAEWTMDANGEKLTVYEMAPPRRRSGDNMTLRVNPEDVVLLPEKT